MRVVFLDVDGVLNASRPVGKNQELILRNWAHPHMVGHVNRIAREGGAVVVVSSTWRLGRELDALREDFRGVGLTAEIAGATPSGPCGWHHGYRCEDGHRGGEIARWLASNPGVESYVILDDSSDMGPLRHRLVHIPWYRGLIRRDLPRVMEVLRTPIGPDEPWPPTGTRPA